MTYLSSFSNFFKASLETLITFSRTDSAVFLNLGVPFSLASSTNSLTFFFKAKREQVFTFSRTYVIITAKKYVKADILDAPATRCLNAARSSPVCARWL